MDIEHYTYLLASPQKITAGDVAELDIVVQKYPYFQSARALQLKGLKNLESFRYNDALRITAAHTADRDILFEYITSEKFIQNEISQSILQHDNSVLDLPIVSEELAEKNRNQKDEEWRVEREKADAILNPDLFKRKVDSLAHGISDMEARTAEAEIKPEEQLVPDKPLEFTKNDTHSFSEWLKLTKAKPIERIGEETKSDVDASETASQGKSSREMDVPIEASANEEKERKFELIDKFIQERTKIMPVGSDHSSPANDREFPKITEPSQVQPTESLMTETLARVYLQQKNYKKAIQAYKILILKNPEKSG